MPAGVPPAVQDVVRRRNVPAAARHPGHADGRRRDRSPLRPRPARGVLDLSPWRRSLDRLEPALDEGLVEVDEPARGVSFSHAPRVEHARGRAERRPVSPPNTPASPTRSRQLRADDLEPWVEDLAHHAAEGLLAGTAPKAAHLRTAGCGDRRRRPVVGRAWRSSFDGRWTPARSVPGFPVRDRRALCAGSASRCATLVMAKVAEMLVEAARLAEVDGDVHTAAEILGHLDIESLWAGYDWSLHDPRVVAAVERLLAQPRLTDRDRTMLTMALAGELTYVDNARSKDLRSPMRARWPSRSVTTSCSARILLQWFWSVSGPSGVATRAAIGDRLVALDHDGCPAVPAASARPPRPGVGGVGARRRRSRPAVRRRGPCPRPPVRTPTGWAHLQFAEAGLALLDGDLERCRAHVAASDRRCSGCGATRRQQPGSILAVVEAESGDIDAALGPVPRCWHRRTADRSDGSRPGYSVEAGRLDDARGLRSPASTARYPTTGCSSR